MKRRVLAVTIISLGVIAFIVSWGEFVDLFNVIGHPPESRRENYFAIVGQGLFYFIFSSIISAFGLLILFGAKGQKIKIVQTTFFAMLTIWFVLEVPIYKCDFYEINHSFWESKRGHFH
jgi:hypothetical protein